MSIIMAAGNCDKVIVMSDGRRTDIDTTGKQIILDEDYKKIRRLNNNLCIAFSGTLYHCHLVIEGASKNLSESTSVEQYMSKTIEWIRKNIDYKHTDFNAQIIIAGFNSLGKLKFNVVRCYDHILTHKRYNLLDEPKFTVCSPLDPNDDFITPIMQQNREIIDQMTDVIKEASKRDQTINDHIFYEILTA